MIVHLVDGTYELFRYFMAPAFDRATPEALWHLGAEFGCIWDRRRMDANVEAYRDRQRN